MENENSEDVGPLEALAGISESLTLFKPKKLYTEVKIKLVSDEYMSLIRVLENMTNVGTDPDSKMFSIDIDTVKFIFVRD